MKYKPGDILYYVNPFVFIIDKVLIEFYEPKDENGNTYYVDHSGAYLLEESLFKDLTDAKNHAQAMLDKFYIEHTHMIQRADPELGLEQND